MTSDQEGYAADTRGIREVARSLSGAAESQASAAALLRAASDDGGELLGGGPELHLEQTRTAWRDAVNVVAELAERNAESVRRTDEVLTEIAKRYDVLEGDGE